MHDYAENFAKVSTHLDVDSISAGEQIIKAFENPNDLDIDHLVSALKILRNKADCRTSTKVRDNILKAILEEDYVEALELTDEVIDAEFERRGY